MSQEDRREARDSDETLELRSAAGSEPTQPLGDAVFGPPDAMPGGPAGPQDAGAPPSGTDGAVPSSAPGTPSAGDVSGTATGPVAAGRLTSPEVPGPPRGPRVGTIVWGFLVVACGAAVLASALGAHVDLGLAAIVVLAVAGVTLVVGSVTVGARRRGRG
jgi:hypothetical protein